MARPPQFETPDPVLVKESLKRLSPEDRARLMAWLMLYFDDLGNLYSPQIRTSQRQRIALSGIEYWLARIPKHRA